LKPQKSPRSAGFFFAVFLNVFFWHLFCITFKAQQKKIIKMTREQQLFEESIEKLKEYSIEDFYNVFGNWLETIVNVKKTTLQERLKRIWSNRTKYAFRDTGEQFDIDTMQFYFESKKIKTYSIAEIEKIIASIDLETIESF
jgi:Lhr-like helicase